MDYCMIEAGLKYCVSEICAYFTVACRNSEDCTHGERCVQNMCTLPCASHTQCPAVQACVSSICLIGCRSSKDCPGEHACVNNKCQGKSLSPADAAFLMTNFVYLLQTI